MAIPEFLADLRAVVGTRMLWLSAVVAVVLDDDGRVLLVQRADDGRWTPPGGILDPGEQPADGAVRECLEESGVVAVPERLVSVTVSPEVTYPNGDLTRYLELVFHCRPVDGEARINDDETLAVGWFGLDELPPMEEKELGWIRHSLADRAAAVFTWQGTERV
ncbi:NUDIX domain-containing protein [Streptomyces sp. BE20]|uniref:NUDIX hydrolase n=1 Tax=Streptomycetaceae TaxID=2062 RepID=UPI002E76AC7B|nr:MULTISPECIES: NUDIX domain-containing protein [unclassified Streptomyces]MED7950088.1 NUDIX domain-containing protein [Streptomyces sp. BE303]MEE1828731.1 NUDIX domain-containing protein [Streptomyces sp. BE20]